MTQDGAGQFHGDPLVEGDVVYIGTDGRTSLVYAFDRLTGEVLWKMSSERVAPGITGFPTDLLPSGESLYTATAGNFVVALDRRGGSVKWVFRGPLAGEERRYPGAPALTGGRLLHAGSDGTLSAFEPSTGAVIWKRALGTAFTTSVVAVPGGDVIVGTEDKRLLRVRPADGKTVAQIELSHRPSYTPVVWKDLAYVVSERELFAVAVSLRKVVWSKTAAKEWSTPRPRIWTDLVVVGDGGDLRAFDARSGQERWKEAFEGTIRGVGSEGDVLYVGTLQGDVVAFRPNRAAAGR